MIGIKAIAPYLPGVKTPVAGLPERDLLTPSQLVSFDTIGIETVYQANDHSGYDIAKAAVKKLLAETGIPGSDVDLIIFIKSRVPEYFAISEASRLQYEIGAANALTFSLSDLGCTDMSMALKQAMDFLVANAWAENVLICYGCKPGTPHRYRHPVTISGDGGIALMVGRTDRNRLVDVEISVDGRYWDLFKTDYLKKKFSEYREEISDERRYGFELALESRNRFFELNQKILNRNGLSKSDIRHFILQNTSSRAYQFYGEAYGIQVSPVCIVNLSAYGHLGPADIMLNYFTGLSNGFFESGDRLLIMNNSSVAAWSSILIET